MAINRFKQFAVISFFVVSLLLFPSLVSASCDPGYTCSSGNPGNFIVRWDPSPSSCCAGETFTEIGYNCEDEACASRTALCTGGSGACTCHPNYECSNGNPGNFISMWNPGTGSCCDSPTFTQEGVNCEGVVCQTRTIDCNSGSNPYNFIVRWEPGDHTCPTGETIFQTGYNCGGHIISTRTVPCTGEESISCGDPPLWGGIHIDACWDLGDSASCGNIKDVADLWCRDKCGQLLALSYSTSQFPVSGGTKYANTGRVCPYCFYHFTSITCGTQLCGDGIVSGTEQCDDDNINSGDGCSSECITEECSSGQSDPNPIACGTDEGVCTTGVRVRTCQSDYMWSDYGSCNGIQPSTEVCDFLDNDCDGSIDEGLNCTPCTTTYILSALRKALYAYYVNPSESGFTSNEVNALLSFYVGIQSNQTTVDCSPQSNNIDKADTLPDNIPICSDGTKYGKCSSTKSIYCYAGRLVPRCRLCGCPDEEWCDETYVYTEKGNKGRWGKCYPEPEIT